eukprot:403351825
MSSLLLNTVFIVMTKGLALSILITLQVFTKQELDKLYQRFQYKPDDKDSVYQLGVQSQQVNSGITIDSILIILLLVSIVVNCTTIGIPLTKIKRHPEKRKSYHELKEESVAQEE